MLSPQSLSDPNRRLVAAWAADCAEHVIDLFQSEAPDDGRPHDAIARARAYSRGELDAAGEIRRRFVAGRAASAVSSSPAIAAARSAAQAAGVAHMGAHALGAAAYAAKARGLSSAHEHDAIAGEVQWQLSIMSDPVRAALRGLPRVGEDPAGPLGAGGLLAAGILGSVIRTIQESLTAVDERQQ